MGKSFNHINGGSQSVSYKSDHSRKKLGLKKKNTHRQVRKNNRMCDEDNIITTNNTYDLVKYSTWTCGYHGKNFIIPNKPYDDLDEILTTKKWTTDFIGDLDDYIAENNENSTYFRAVKKQILRRGKTGIFDGHDKLDLFID
jgi:hypothetical protein